LLFEMAEVISDFHGELNDVLSKVNSWALGKEKELLSLQAEHTSFLDTHKGVLPALHGAFAAAKWWIAGAFAALAIVASCDADRALHVQI